MFKDAEPTAALFVSLDIHGATCKLAPSPGPAAPGIWALSHLILQPWEAVLLAPVLEMGDGGCGLGPLLPVCDLPTPLHLNLVLPDSNKEEQHPRNAVKRDVGQKEADIEAGSPEQVLQRRVEEGRRLRAAGRGS